MTRRSDELRRQLTAMLEREARQEAVYGDDSEVGSTVTLIKGDEIVALVRREQGWASCVPPRGTPAWWVTDYRATWGEVCDKLDGLPDAVRILRSVGVQEVDR